MSHPAAWVPYKVVARELLKIARALRIIPMPGDTRELADGRQSVVIQSDGTDSDNLPAVISGNRIFLPPLLVNFYNFIPVPAQAIVLPAVPAGELRWLILSVTCEAENTDIITGGDPVTASFDDPANPGSYTWSPDADQGYETGIAAGDPRRYFWPLLSINSEGVIYSTIGNTFIDTFPNHPFV